jgi:hypothetical protein
MGPTPAWSLASAAAELDKVLTRLPTALLEALMRLERAPARGEPCGIATQKPNR